MFDLERFHRDGLTVADLAHLAQVDPSTAWRWISRGVRPSPLARQRLKRRGLWREAAPVAGPDTASP